jgi:hypothetical protein
MEYSRQTMFDNNGLKRARPGAGPVPAGPSGQRETASEAVRMSREARRELELARRMRADAYRYQQETANRARSDAQALILQARMATRREIDALVRSATEEIQKILTDIRIIRITAEEELAAQRKFTDAARLASIGQNTEVEERERGVRKKRRAGGDGR